MRLAPLRGLAILTIAAVGQAQAPFAALADDWRTYHNDRYGTTIDYPSIFKPGTPPDSDDGLAFTSADGADSRSLRRTMRSVSTSRSSRILL